MANTSVAPVEHSTERRERFRSARTAHFTESVIREMTRLAVIHKAVNLAQGFPDFSAPANLMDAVCEAIQADFNQYPITWGTKPFRGAVALLDSETAG